MNVIVSNCHDRYGVSTIKAQQSYLFRYLLKNSFFHDSTNNCKFGFCRVSNFNEFRGSVPM